MTGELTAQVGVVRGDFRLDATLDAVPHEVVALVGPNGAGKSSLLRALAGLTPLQEGRIELGGRVLDDPAQDVFVPAHQRQIGVVFQDYLLFGHLSVLDNVAFGLRRHGLGRHDARVAARPWVELFDLDDLAGRRPRTLSGGQAQRVAVARALASGPALLLLDEPLAALDARTRLEVRAGLRTHLTGYGGPSVVVTHDPLEAMVLADRLVVLEQGRVVQQGRPADVARRPATRYVATLLGLTLHHGSARAGTVALDGGGRLVVADPDLTGRVLVAVRPEAVSLHASHPEGSPRNVWAGTVSGLEMLGHRVRVAVDGQPPMLADVTPAAVAELGLAPGAPVWLSVKATELEAYPDSA